MYRSGAKHLNLLIAFRVGKIFAPVTGIRATCEATDVSARTIPEKCICLPNL